MLKIIETIEKMSNLLSIGVPEMVDIENAERELSIKFANEYREYLCLYGAVLADGIELTGIAKSKNRNVVLVTKREWDANDLVPHDMYVIENVGIEGIIIWQDENGKIYQSSPNKKPELIADCLVEYLNNILG